MSQQPISRQQFISLLQAAQYISDSTGYSLKCAASLIDASNVFYEIPLFLLDLLTARANDVSPKHDNDYDHMNEARENFSHVSDGHHEYRKFASFNTVTDRVFGRLEQYGWERQAFLSYVASFFGRISTAFGQPCESEKQYCLNRNHPRYAPKLAAAIQVWEAMDDVNLIKGRSPKSAMESWLESRYKELGLIHKGKMNKTAIQEVAKVANWQEDGGAPHSNLPTP